MKFKHFVNENLTEKRFIVNNNKFQLFLGNILITESDFSIEQSDEWFNQKYVTIFDLKTDEKFHEIFQ